MISIIIPSYNAEKTIRGCLDSLQRQSFAGEKEIILVDSSQDNTAAIVSAEYPHIQLIRRLTKTDPGTARNMGVEHAKGEVIAFIDADCTAEINWLESITSALDNSKCSAVGGAICCGNKDNDRVGWAGYIAEFREFLPGAKKKITRHVPTCNAAYRREVFETCGLFQGDYYPQEDLLFNMRLSQGGGTVLFDPSIRVFHLHRSHVREFFVHQFRIGAVTPRVMKEASLPGAFISRNPAAALCVVPFLPAVKFLRTLAVFLLRATNTVLFRPFSWALFAMGLLFWSAGFTAGVFHKSE